MEGEEAELANEYCWRLGEIREQLESSMRS